MGVADSQSVIDALAELDISKQEVLTLPLPVDQGGTGGNTPYVTDAFDNSANFVMYDGQNARYNAAPMSALKGYLDNVYAAYKPINILAAGTDLNTLTTLGSYGVYNSDVAKSLINAPNGLAYSCSIIVTNNSSNSSETSQCCHEIVTGKCWYRSFGDSVHTPGDWILLYPTPAPAVPDKFSYAVSPFPTGTWEGEMTVNVVPVFSVNIGAVTYVTARVYGSKKFNYTGTADNINLFSSLKPVGGYTSVFSGSTNIPLTLSVSGRSYTAGTYGLTPNVSGSNLYLNNQIVSSKFNLGDFNISTNLKCVFGEGTNTPGVTVSVNCMALMWHSLS